MSSLVLTSIFLPSAAGKNQPGFGAAWIRVAELEFGFGRTSEALAALNKGLDLSPRNAEGLALKGFLLTDGLEAPTPPTEVDRPVRETNLPTGSSMTQGR